MKERLEPGISSKAQLTTKSINHTLNIGSIMPEGDAELKTLAHDVQEIVERRKSQGVTAEEAEAARAVWGSVFERKLTPGEFQRAIFGMENPEEGKQAEEFEDKIGIIEDVVSAPKRFDAFVSSIDKKDPESIKQAMSGVVGKVALGIMMGDIADGREEYQSRLGKILNGERAGIKKELTNLAREIEKKEKEEAPRKGKSGEIEEAKKVAEKLIADARKKRNVTAEEIEEIMKRVETGEPLIAGGADYSEHFEELKDTVDNIPDEIGDEEFINRKANVVDTDFIDNLLLEIYPRDTAKAQAERNRINRLKEINNPAVFRQEYNQMLEELEALYKESSTSDEDQQEEDRKIAEELINSGEITKGGKNFKKLEWVDDGFFSKNDVRGVEELGTWIVSSDDLQIWGPGGLYPIFELDYANTRKIQKRDPETGRTELVDAPVPIFQEQNFLRWLRSKALEHHGDNPNDPINLLQSVAIETAYRSVSIITMKYNKQKYFSDPDGNLLNNLANEAIGEAFLFGTRRNKDLAYKQVMNSDEKLFEAMIEMSAKNDHTSATNLADLLRMGEGFRESEGGNIDNKVGDAMLAANQIYRNISDIERLQQILPADSPIFTIEGFKNAVRVLNGQSFDEEPVGYGNLFFEGRNAYFKDPRTGVYTHIFKDGKLVLSKKNDEHPEVSEVPENLVKFLNIFPSAQPEETNEEVVRELVKQSIAKIVNFDAGEDIEKYEEFKKIHGDISLSDYRKNVRINLEWAEINAWSEQRWNGAAARNDTGYRGYDAWTKMYAQYYRERQSGSRTAGPIGNPEDMQIFRMMSPDMWLAIRTESGQAVQEVFDELHTLNLQVYRHPEGSAEREELEKKKEQTYKKLRFPRWTELDWAANGLKRQSEVWHNMLNTEDINFNEIVKRDNWGILKFDRAKFEEVVKDDFIKKRRYALSSNNAMNYGALTRMRERVGIEWNEDGTVGKEIFAYKNKYLAEAMFGEVVMGSIRREWYDGELEFKAADDEGREEAKNTKNASLADYLNSAAAREKILKNVCRAGLAAQLRAHRKFDSLDERWDNDAVRNFYRALRSMPQYIEDPATGKEIVIPNSQFFSEDDIAWIRKHSNTTRSRMLAEDIGLTTADALAGALPGAVQVFFKDVIS